MNEQIKMSGLIRNQVQVLEEELGEAKQNYASYHLDENADWRCRDNARTKCKVIEGQIFILNKLEKDFASMASAQLVGA